MEMRPDGTRDATVPPPGSHRSGEAQAASERERADDEPAQQALGAPWLPPGREVDLSVLTTAAQICIDRRAFLIIDAPVSWTTSDAAPKRCRNSSIIVGVLSISVFG